MKRYLLELAERTVAVYALTGIGLITASGFDLTDIGALRAAAIASIPAGLTVVYGALAAFVGDKTPALLPSRKSGE